jgi:hypothetical protein
VAKHIKLAMLDFAKRTGAWRGGRPDWYLVAERLAEISKPELLSGDRVATRGPGRPKSDDDFLAMEVHRVMWAFNVGVAQACRRISRGDKVPLATRPWQVSAPTDGGEPSIARQKGRYVTKGSAWKGIPATTLASRYWRWRHAEQKRQQKLAVKIL